MAWTYDSWPEAIFDPGTFIWTILVETYYSPGAEICSYARKHFRSP